MNQEKGVIIGTVIALADSPSTQKVDFVLKDDAKCLRGEIVIIYSDNRRIMASVGEIRNSNVYYSSADVTKESQQRVTSLFPTDEWELSLVSCKPLGELDYDSEAKKDRVHKLNFPCNPGATVHSVTQTELSTFLGLVENGLELGIISPSETKARIDLTRLLRKHLAILAISGAGKSYATAVLVEELMSRSTDQGRLPVLIIDPHGEYIHLSKAYPDRTIIIKGSYFAIDTSSLSAWNFKEYEPEMTPVQVRELESILARLKEQGKGYDIRDIIRMLDESTVNTKTKDTLISWLYQLDSTHFFSNLPNPRFTEIITPGKLIIFDLSDLYNERDKQILCSYIARKTFNLRRSGSIPPYLLIVEEAHNFCPEGVVNISRPIIETIAREGRKFFASLCLISQRPVRLSSTVLSQCNSHLIMRIRNPYDLDYIGKQSEGINRDTLNTIPDLDVGEAILVGEAVNYPVFLRIRKKKYISDTEQLSFTEIIKQYESKQEK